MEPQTKQKRNRFKIEKMEERIAPAHVHLPMSPAHLAGQSAATENNPHFSGKLRPLPFVDPEVDL